MFLLCCTSWEPAHVLIIHLTWKSMKTPYATGFSKCVTWTNDKTSSTQLALPSVMGGLGVPSASLSALPSFLASTFGGGDFLPETLAEILSIPSQKRLKMAEFEIWTVKSSRLNPKNLDSTCRNRPRYDFRSKNFNAHQGTFGSQWLNVVPCKNLGLKLDDQQLRIPIGLRLGANICVAHTCHCGKRVELDRLHDLSCTKIAGRFSRHATL